MALSTGDIAPDFTLYDDATAPFSLSEARSAGPVVEGVGVSSEKRPTDGETDFHFLEVGDRTYMLRCRREVPFGIGYHGGFAHWRRTTRGEPRWMVSVETDRDAWPVVREAYVNEAGARARVRDLETGLTNGSITLPRWPAVIRLAPWLRRPGSG